MLFLADLPFALIGLAIVVFLVALLPTRRLYLAGWPPRWLLSYLAVLMGLGLLIVELRLAARYLIPFAVVVYLAPFVTAPVMERFLRPRDRGPRLPPRNVTPPGSAGGTGGGEAS